MEVTHADVPWCHFLQLISLCCPGLHVVLGQSLGLLAPSSTRSFRRVAECFWGWVTDKQKK